MLNRKELQFDKLLDRATSNLLLEPDWNLNIQVCDLIRQKDVRSKHAVDAIRKKFKSENPNVLYFTLLVLEACMKNCGDPFHAEIATKSFMTEIHGILQVSTADKVRRKILELIQKWEFAFRNQPKYRAVGDLLAIVKMEGYKLPEFVESDKMYTASVAPQIIDAEYCYRCRITFSLLQKKSPCVNCGHMFCVQCTSHKMPLRHFGIEKLVSVCETCWHSLRKPPLPPKPQFPTQEKSAAPLKSAEQADEELKRAIQLSIQEEKTKKAEMQEADKELELAVRLSKQEEEGMKKYKGNLKENTTALCRTTPELIRYLDRQYWEKRSEKLSQEKITSPLQQKTRSIKVKNATVTDKLDNFAGELKSTLEGFVNRLLTNANRGRSIIDDTYVQSLFGKISAMNYQLISYLEELSTTRTYYESLQDKIYQLQDGAAAFQALRNEHSERQMQLAKKEKFLRDIQMAQKVREVRKQKQEILQAEARKTLLQLQKTKEEMLLKKDRTSLDVNPSDIPPIDTTTSMQPTCPSYPYNPFYAEEESNVPSPTTPMAQGIQDPDSVARSPQGNVFLPESYSSSETSTSRASKPPCSMAQISTRKSSSEAKKRQSTPTKGKPNT